ncbi:MAG: 6-phosphogluconolactonase [Luteimonas sp.]
MKARDDVLPHEDIAGPRVHFLAYQSVEQWAWASAVTLAGELRRELEQRPRARLLLSGGKTPAPVYEALARAPLDWARIDVGLVDERWLQPDDPDSNSHLVRQTLLRDKAANARFETLTRIGRSIEESVAAANLHATHIPDAVVLGMGDDGHTASLFPGMRGLEQALANPNAYVAVDASGCPGAGPWPRRISLTPAGLAPSRMRLLLIRGEHKRKLFERAVDGLDPLQFPVRLTFTTPGARLRVHWCP